MLRKFFILILICFFKLSFLEAKTSLFVGYANNYANIGSLRLGIETWEFGILSTNFYGAEKIYSFGNYYTGLGLGLKGESFGFQGSAGFNLNMLSMLNLRGELYIIHLLTGFDEGRALLGLHLNF